jgi:hypothetical protein
VLKGSMTRHVGGSGRVEPIVRMSLVLSIFSRRSLSMVSLTLYGNGLNGRVM